MKVFLIDPADRTITPVVFPKIDFAAEVTTMLGVRENDICPLVRGDVALTVHSARQINIRDRENIFEVQDGAHKVRFVGKAIISGPGHTTPEIAWRALMARIKFLSAQEIMLEMLHAV